MIGRAGSELKVGLGLGLLFLAGSVVLVGLFHCGFYSYRDWISYVFRVLFDLNLCTDLLYVFLTFCVRLVVSYYRKEVWDFISIY